MASTISINTLDDTAGVSQFITLNVGDTTLYNNLVRASTLKKIVIDNNFGGLLADNSVPTTKLNGILDQSYIGTQTLSGAIGATLVPPKNGHLAWYTITPLNLAYNTLFWDTSGLGINTSSLEANLHVAGTLYADTYATIGNSLSGTVLHLRGTRDTAAQILFENKTTNNKKYIRINEAGSLQILSDSYDVIYSLDNNGTFSLNSSLIGGVGSQTSPTFTFADKTNYGMYYSTASSAVAIAASGVNVVNIGYSRSVFKNEITTLNQITNRLIYGSYGVFDYSNGETYYKLITNQNDPYGNANGLKPISINLLTGRVGIGGDYDNSTFSASLKVTGREYVTSDLKVGGTLNVAGRTDIGGSTYISGDLQVSGNIFPSPLQGVPAGGILPFAINFVPVGWLACDGQAVSRTAYSRLFEAISTTYGAGDGTTTFNVPDLRGLFIRGFGGNSAANFGEVQADQIGSHTHTGSTNSAGNHVHTGSTGEAGGHNHSYSDRYATQDPGGGGGSGSSADDRGDQSRTTGWAGSHSHTINLQPAGNHVHSLNIAPAGGSETRPKNISLLYCIRT